VCRVTTRAAARRFFEMPRVRRRVGAEKVFGASARRSLDQCIAMYVTLENRQAIHMRPDATGEERIARPGEMLRRDRCRDGGRSRGDEIRSLLRGDVLDDDPKAW